MELWDVFDRLRQPQNRTVERGSVADKNDFHIIVHSWVRRKSDNKLLISKRVKNIFWGGYWQVTAGSVISGETSKEAAVRELNEELGIKAEKARTFLLFSYRCMKNQEKTASFFVDSWLFEIDDIDSKIEIILQKEEVEEAKWCTFEEMIDLWKNGLFMPVEQTWSPYFDILQKTLKKPETIQSLKTWGSAELRLSKTTTPELDASLILSYVLGYTKNELFVNSANKVSKEQIFDFSKLLYKRADGLPVAYITGQKEFWKSIFKVSPSVLIPKPDTELLVELAVNLIRARIPDQSVQMEKKLNLADVCTGSGCVGISVFLETINSNISAEKLHFVLTDISEKALSVAKENAQRILGKNAKNIKFVQGDLLKPLLENKCVFDIVLANPPYVPSKITDELLQDGRSEPRLALDGGVDGLDIIKRLIPEVWQVLNKNGILLIETGEYNAAQTAKLLTNAGFSDIETFTVLGGQPRVTQARKP